MKTRLIFTEESNLQEVCVKDEKDRKRSPGWAQYFFASVSSGGMAVMATNILSNAVFHIIEGNIVNHKICVRYLEEIYQSVYVLVLASFGM